ncbi:MAG: leucine--tRNA ligase [Weeping tea tree witches'-broom phytoplasma]|uniref:leucine--tRNA ligase n=1 Tax=Candidatus Phytoplasma melaleucae TaxID=2982630 RepID=UPI002939BDAF|nr:leucine--tRNA ligase [Weeping tea tree witches'-broom phytoplasma]
MLVYDFDKIELKWQLHWEKQQTFKTDDDFSKKKFYCLDMFPYPSAQGLHVGHIEGYTASDVINRFKRMRGYNVLHPFGWDSFGLPAERYALQTGNHPQYFTYENIDKFRKQIKKLGKGVDWSRELATSEPYFYKWTQWFFKQFYIHGLAVLKDVEVNFCEQLGTVLSNEEVITTENGTISERGSYPVVKKTMKQWVIKINNYADRLLEDIELLDWPSKIKEMQKNWIGKKKGFIFNFPIVSSKEEYLSVFTTLPYTIFGVSALVLAPEHTLVSSLTTLEFADQVDVYLQQTKRKTSLEREINKEVTGVFTGSYAINPCNRKKVPIWVSDYVLVHYGTGAVMSVPCHDAKDFVFATKYSLEMNVIKYCSEFCALKMYQSNIQEPCLKTSGVLINSDFLNGFDVETAQKKIIELAESNNWGYIHSTYKMHDWFYSRQLYWGEPFPVYYDNDNNIYLMPDKDLPLELPQINKIEIAGDGTSPLSKINSWLYFEKEGKIYKRDSNTMPQFAASSWYYIGYVLKNYLGMIPLNTVKAKKLLDYFLPVDVYVGGSEHAVGHLIYSRFWHKFLYDLGLVSTKEPFTKLVNQGMILGHDNLKMSKSKGNIVSASQVLQKYGADVLRLYIMFLGPLEDNKVWTYKGLKGIQRFLNRVYHVFILFNIVDDNYSHLNRIMHQTIKNVTEYYEKFKFNKVVSQLMIFINEIYRYKKIGKEQIRIFLQLLNPLAPHLTEELNQTKLKLGEELVYLSWPCYNKSFLSINENQIVIQINGKLRSKIFVEINAKKNTVLQKALKDKKIAFLLKNKEITQSIYVINKLLNLVVV